MLFCVALDIIPARRRLGGWVRLRAGGEEAEEKKRRKKTITTTTNIVYSIKTFIALLSFLLRLKLFRYCRTLLLLHGTRVSQLTWLYGPGVLVQQPVAAWLLPATIAATLTAAAVVC